jgi:hypothetical protein
MSWLFQQLFSFFYRFILFTITHYCLKKSSARCLSDIAFQSAFSGYPIKAKPRNLLRGLYFSQFVVLTIEQHYMPRLRDKVLLD